MKNKLTVVLKVILSLLLSAAGFYFASRNVDWDQLKAILSDAKIAPILAGVAVSLVSFWLRAWRWQILLAPFKKVSLMKLLRWQVGGLFINNLLPLRMGDLARGYWAGHKASISKTTSLATIVVERSADVASIACIGTFLFSLSGFPLSQKIGGPKTLLGALLFSGAAGWILWSKLDHDKLGERIKNFLPGKLGGLAGSFLDGLKILQDGRETAKVAALSCVIWCTDITVLFIFSRALSLQLSWLDTGLVIVGLILGVMVPAAPGAVGTYEAGGVAVLTRLGVDATLAFSYVLMVHAVQYLFIFILGLPSLLIEGFNPKDMIKET